MNDPFKKFNDWFEKAKETEFSYPESFTLSTVSNNLQTSSRTLLLRGISESELTFYTNYNSKKGSELGENNKASMLFYWKTTQKQIRVEGQCEKSSSTASDEYWAKRPYESRLHAFVSKQSEVINLNKSEINSLFKEVRSKYPTDIPRPEHWGGFNLKPNYFEFWEEGDFRWHKRESYTLINNEWTLKSLYP